MKLLRLSTLLLLTSFLFYGCQRSSDFNTDPPQTFVGADYKLFTPAYYRESPDGASIQVRFYESPRIFDLPKNNPDFETIKSMLDDNQLAKSPLRVFTENEQLPVVTITAAQKASAEDIQNFNNAKVIVPPPATIKKIVPDMETLNEMFEYFKQQGCATGTATIDYCITFQYVVDGCYARAHKMRQIMENEFGYSCEKVFSYEGATGYLAVDAGDCCVYWWYHVAPLVTVRDAHQLKKFVMDPSMFDGPVTIETWTGAQENFDCTPYADFGYSEITPGYVYGPGGSTDNFYSSTNWTLQWYADLVTCL